MKLLVKKFHLRHNGRTYASGQIAELPEVLAVRLAEQHPKEFVLLEEFPAVGQLVNEEGINGPVFDEMTAAELKALATELGIDLGTAKKKQDIIDIIVAASESPDDEQLPPADLNGPLQ